MDKNEKKHLYSPAKDGQTPGRWMPEFDPIFSCDSWYQRASNAVNCTLGSVSTSRSLFAYGFVIANLSTTVADVRILEGAGTLKLRTEVIGGDCIIIGHGDPRAPICKFNSGNRALINSTPANATVHVTMSWWDAELR